jgi:hypothetical protein
LLSAGFHLSLGLSSLASFSLFSPEPVATTLADEIFFEPPLNLTVRQRILQASAAHVDALQMASCPELEDLRSVSPVHL